ncbi:GH32 C-terminal domain-containing protein [Terriglobus tenax]|uniref:GH32 C-terminal domain-containing protein n=1 Tax=Terriglobus tenax TaxID=1111115 RepID=UPI0021E0E849|nr:GH32 C-terminal domain-containing protein [Terriglobus tenax]
MQSSIFNVTRRSFVIASCGLLIPRLGWAAITSQPVLYWPLNDPKAAGRESTTGSQATIVDGTGRLEWIKNGDTEIPRLDGYSVWVEHRLDAPVRLRREVTVSAWMALESFPVNTASIIEWNKESSIVRLAIDRLGFLLFSIEVEGQKFECRTEHSISLGNWHHAAATLAHDGTITLFLDGKKVSRSPGRTPIATLGDISTVFLGRAVAGEIVAKVFPTSVLNGLLREVRVYDTAIADRDINALSQEFQPSIASLSPDGSWFSNDPQRPQYHAMPPRAWTNEPHGLVHFRGQYHLFYQKNANGPYWGHIHWGHMTSPDLLQWTEQPMALIPSPGPDSEGCWSGSALVDNGKIVLIYTGGDGKRASICMASSEDGVHFTKYAGNPIIEAPPSGVNAKEFRDPFIWKEGAEYRMIIGSGITDVGGTALLYRSQNLTSWTYLKPLLIGDKANSGVFWEMPVFVKIGDRHVLIVCEVPGRASYWVGTWEHDEFHVLSKEPQRLDLFNHFLSPTPYIDEKGRAITIGIVPDSRAPIEAWQAGWAHLYGLPRELTLSPEVRLQQQPIEELANRFALLASSEQKRPLGQNWTLLDGTGTCVHLKAQVERGASDSITIALRRSPDRQEETLLRYDWRSSQLTLDRTKSSLDTHTRRDRQEVSYAPRVSGKLDLELFVDQSVIEVFIDKRSCFATRAYPVLPESVGITACCEGGEAYLTSLRVSVLRV